MINIAIGFLILVDSIFVLVNKYEIKILRDNIKELKKDLKELEENTSFDDTDEINKWRTKDSQ